VTRPNRRQFLHESFVLAAGVVLTGVAAGCRDSNGGDSTSARASTTTRAVVRAPAGADAVAHEAFLAGFPLVTTVRTMQTFAQLFGVNQLNVRPGLTNPTSHFVVAPNRDTVYALAVLDLRAGAHVLSVPAIPDRYHVIQFLDAWMGDFALVGTRTTGGRGGTWIITPPGHKGPIPSGSRRLAAPTNQVILLGRIRAVDDADATAASADFSVMTLAPLDTGAAPAPALAAPAGTPQSVGANGIAFFDEVGDALVANPPVTVAQRHAMNAAAAIGVGAGRHPSTDPSAQTTALASGVTSGLAAIEDPTVRGSRTVDGWTVNLDLGKEATTAGLLSRAVVAKYYWGPVPAKEAVYPRAATADDGLALDGSKQYRIHFAAGKTPPVNAFWSVTVYGPDMFLVPNAVNRYSISGDTPGLVRNADRSLDLFLQQQAPAAGTANWLPVPAGPFNLVMRCYLPRAPILDGSYSYPPITVTA
jgi:hypothetical protein